VFTGSGSPGQARNISRSYSQCAEGEWGAVVVLVQRWQMLVDDVLEAASVEVPESVCRVGDRYRIRTVSGKLDAEPVRYLHHLIGNAVFSPMIPRFGPDIGLGVAAIEGIRSLLPGHLQMTTDESLG
jgi:hypothetical protein